MRPTSNKTVRKPLTVIIVTLSVVCTLKGKSRQSIQRIKAMLLCIQFGILFVKDTNIKHAMHWMLCLSTLSILVFLALTKHLIQSTMKSENSTLLCIKWLLTPARREGYLLQYSIWKAFRLGSLAVHQSEEAALLSFLDLSTTRVIVGKMHSQSPIPKTKGVLSNPVILTDLQSCILHTLTKLPAYFNFDSKSVFSAWRLWACRVPLEVAGSVSGKVGSHEQVDLPIHRFQH